MVSKRGLSTGINEKKEFLKKDLKVHDEKAYLKEEEIEPELKIREINDNLLNEIEDENLKEPELKSLKTYKTDFDTLIALVQEKKIVTLSQVIKKFKINKKIANEWGNILSENGILNFYIPIFGDPEFRRNDITTSKEILNKKPRKEEFLKKLKNLKNDLQKFRFDLKKIGIDLSKFKIKKFKPDFKSIKKDILSFKKDTKIKFNLNFLGKFKEHKKIAVFFIVFCAVFIPLLIFNMKDKTEDNFGNINTQVKEEIKIEDKEEVLEKLSDFVDIKKAFSGEGSYECRNFDNNIKYFIRNTLLKIEKTDDSSKLIIKNNKMYIFNVKKNEWIESELKKDLAVPGSGMYPDVELECKKSDIEEKEFAT
jgi:hypothetical protein